MYTTRRMGLHGQRMSIFATDFASSLKFVTGISMFQKSKELFKRRKAGSPLARNWWRILVDDGAHDDVAGFPAAITFWVIRTVYRYYNYKFVKCSGNAVVRVDHFDEIICAA